MFDDSKPNTTHRSRPAALTHILRERPKRVALQDAPGDLWLANVRAKKSRI
jgi:hypothetical protein